MDLSKIPVLSALTRRMAWLARRQEVLAQNIANADTPGYKPFDLEPLDFKHLAEAAGRRMRVGVTNARHLIAASQRSEFKATRQTENYETSPGGNAVVLEEQLFKVTQTVMDHRLMANLYLRHIKMIKTALGRSNG